MQKVRLCSDEASALHGRPRARVLGRAGVGGVAAHVAQVRELLARVLMGSGRAQAAMRLGRRHARQALRARIAWLQRQARLALQQGQLISARRGGAGVEAHRALAASGRGQVWKNGHSPRLEQADPVV